MNYWSSVLQNEQSKKFTVPGFHLGHGSQTKKDGLLWGCDLVHCNPGTLTVFLSCGSGKKKIGIINIKRLHFSFFVFISRLVNKISHTFSFKPITTLTSVMVCGVILLKCNLNFPKWCNYSMCRTWVLHLPIQCSPAYLLFTIRWTFFSNVTPSVQLICWIFLIQVISSR